MGEQQPPSGKRLLSSADLAEALDCGEADLGELQAAAREVLASPLLADPRQQLEKQRLFRRVEEEGPLEVGRWVHLEGLQAASLNGREGVVIAPLSPEGRLGVSVARSGDKLVRPINLRPFPDDRTVKVARVYARGERRAGALTWRWPPEVLFDRPHEISPISVRLGIPLNVMRVEPDRPPTKGDDLESDWVGHLMLEPETGRVLRPWNRKPGPVIAWRADGADFTADDLCLLICFVDGLLARYGDKEWPLDLDSEVTPEAFASFVALELALQASGEDPEEQERGQWWEDVTLLGGYGCAVGTAEAAGGHRQLLPGLREGEEFEEDRGGDVRQPAQPMAAQKREE